MPKRRDLQICMSIEGKRKNPTVAGFCTGSRIYQTIHAAPARQNRYVLRLIDGVSYRGRHDARSSVKVPKPLAVGGAIRGEDSVGTAVKHQIAPGSQRAASFAYSIRCAPYGFLYGRIPRQ